MKIRVKLNHRQVPLVAMILPALLFALACGAAEPPAPTPTPVATATSTPAPTAAPLATSTPTRPGPVATPTPTSVASPSPTPGVQPKKGGVFRISGSDVPHYDSQIHSTQPYYNPLAKLYNNVFVNYVDDKVECEICKEWRLENSGKTMALTMIEGVKFHDGREMTSADVAYSLKKMTGEIDGISSPRCGVLREYVTSIETPSKYVLRINISRGAAFVPKALTIASCVIYPDKTTRQDLQSQAFGSGPFLLKSAITGAGWKLERNPNYFKPGLPYLDSIEMPVTGGEPATIAAFYTGKIDYTGSRSPAAQYLPQLYKLRDDGRVNYRKGIAGCHPHGAFVVTTKPPFNDIKVRKAMNLALDRVAWSNTVYNGDTVPQLLFTADSDFGRPSSEIWNVLPGWGTGAKKQQEIEEAKKLLTEAGFPKGMDIPQMSATSGSTLTMNEAINQQLALAGIRTKMELTEAVERSNRELKLDYIILAWRYCQTTMDPDELIGQMFISGGSRNVSGYINPEIDKMYAQMSGELDITKRKQLVRQMEDIIVLRDVVYGPMPEQFDEGFWWKRVKNHTFGLSSGFASGQYRADTIWVEQ
ncbi:MAG: hypothetical protein EXR53_02870 [Dehalococcoidia bacterium]|nr:hypothetical protein [Dehalococcoidia bacterium]